jgi:hypothetical protein
VNLARLPEAGEAVRASEARARAARARAGAG